MQVPEHLVSLYVATCGQNAGNLGSDEKEIILLVYVILEASTGNIVGTRQILVRPDGTFVKDRTSSQSSDTSNHTAASPPLTGHGHYNNNSTNSSNNNELSGSNNNNSSTSNGDSNGNLNLNATTAALGSSTAAAAAGATPALSTSAIRGANSSMANAGSGCATATASNGGTASNITATNNNNNSSSAGTSSSAIMATTGGLPGAPSTALATTGGTPTTTVATVAPVSETFELPIALAQAAGKPLHEAIEEIDEYLRSFHGLSIGSGVGGSPLADLTIITDGQLPLRQCLHREASVKDISLPNYYNRFCDLRKEFLKYKAGDLARALVPVKDIKKILQMPTLPPPPQSIAEILKELNISGTEETEFYVRESRDMVTVIQTMLKAGHKFSATEAVNLVLEPGICSIDDEIDGNCIVRARGLPWQSSDQDIAKFFRGLNVAKGGVALCLSPLGRRNGEALIRFISQEHRDMALKRHKHHIGNRYIEVYRATGDDFLAVAGGASNEAQAFLSKGAQVIIRMRGLPYDCTAKQVLDFFTAGDNPCDVLDANEGVLFVKKPDGRATGDAFVLFASEIDAPKALGRHRESIGQRYIELFRSTTAEVQQVLNRSMDPKTYESNHQPPLIAQLPAMQLSLLPQHLITSGTTRNCIRLRGLPYEALVEHILHFLDDFAKHIIYQGVHMVINAQGQPSGEAFIQMDTEDSARLCAQRKHNQFMVFGKKYRYIEVFQCSGDDMNMVLNGGLHSPVGAHHPSAVGKQTSLLSPVIGTCFGTFAHFGPPPTPLLASPHHRAHHHHHAHHAHHHSAAATHAHSPAAHPTAAFYSHPFVYWSYPTPPVSPTTYFNQPAHSPNHVTSPHQPLYPLDFMAANYAAQTAPLSPPTVAIPTGGGHPAAGITILSPAKVAAVAAAPPPPPTAVVAATAAAALGGAPKQYAALPMPTAVTVTAGHAPIVVTTPTAAKIVPQLLQAAPIMTPRSAITMSTVPLSIDTAPHCGGVERKAVEVVQPKVGGGGSCAFVNGTTGGGVNNTAGSPGPAVGASGGGQGIVVAPQCVELYMS